MVPPASQRVPRVHRYSGSCCSLLIFAYVALTLFGCPSHDILLTIRVRPQSATPDILLYPVWPLSLSLAATLEIEVSFSSSSYLDVSVQRVTFAYLWIQYTMPDFYPGGFPHSDICGSMDICS